MLTWPSFIKTFIITAVAAVAVVYLCILMVDPYASFSFSLPFDREPISTNQRFSYPSLARNPSFDSAIIGTSTARLLKPARLNKLTGDNWVNLAMNSATAYEQMEMLKLFLRHHPDSKRVVIGIDDAWCRPDKEIQKFTFRPFPPWMYDENPWNDLLYLFNDKALENTVRLIEYWAGEREAKYDKTGYRDFTEDFGPYDLKRSRQKLYEAKTAERTIPAADPLPPVNVYNGLPEYQAHVLLKEALSTAPRGTEAVIIYMPMHAAYLNKNKMNYRTCKKSVRMTLEAVGNVRHVDLMQISDMTRRDENYWDPLHFTTNVAESIENLLKLP